MAEKTVSVTFLQDYQVKAAGGATYTKGDKADLPESSATHFLSRGVAEISKAETAKK